ncbi:myc proto-oncogene protein-like [Cotesia glomerata]|uniref:myc proto-oncogene protein-like n=1 Tax=Cotesia glomerata TaxID=32391 RepID=UPI001D021677|nr:myc proto-oncogene protein-like [Cotesia glomerata]
MMPEQLGTIVSESVWEKFDLETFNSSGGYEQDKCSLFDIAPETFESMDYSKYVQILAHDCMWVGLCVSKEHNKMWATENLGFSPPRLVPETPQNSCFSYEHSDIEEELMVYLSASPSEVTGQYLSKSSEIKDEVTQTDLDYSTDIRSDNTVSKSTEVNNTLPDRDDYRNDLTLIKKFNCLSVQKTSGSEEEIDVVKIEEPASIFTSSSTEDHETLQSTVEIAVNNNPAPRRRGRPPKSYKPPADIQVEERISGKRAAVRRSCQKQTTNGPKKIGSSTSTSMNTKKYSSPASVRSEDKSDTDQRSYYNKMEQQRRHAMKIEYRNLQCLIPNLQNKVNASVISILREGIQYCKEIYKTERNLITKKLELKKRQYELMSELSSLRRHLAQHR